MSDSKTIVHANDWIVSDVLVRSHSTFGLTLGEIRRFVLEANDLDMPDKETVYLQGITASAHYVDQRTAKLIQVRHQRKAEQIKSTLGNA